MYNYKSVAKVIKRGRHGMFGTVLQVPDRIAEYIGYNFFLIYGNACFYCKSKDEVRSECAKHNWSAMFYESDSEP